MIKTIIYRIYQSIKRIFLFYKNAIYFRVLFKYNFLKYSMFIPVKFLLYLFYGPKKGHKKLKELNLLESDINYDNNKLFKAVNVIYFFEQFVFQIYEIFPIFKIKKKHGYCGLWSSMW